ncbi:hypothetical protein [Bradyrhizobium liaoningense]|uniref:hypothetical protein n=1 Tax=Bradyrhizobium liaoningense TaxID=43992 RepID=UPI001BA7284D|nr:hypothetical protein [Bradyrhizobium liaoningense]MBR0903712.1 hypothetical protein [Bradyrhizobium liaoningense]
MNALLGREHPRDQDSDVAASVGDLAEGLNQLPDLRLDTVDTLLKLCDALEKLASTSPLRGGRGDSPAPTTASSGSHRPQPRDINDEV